MIMIAIIYIVTGKFEKDFISIPFGLHNCEDGVIIIQILQTSIWAEKLCDLPMSAPSI